jgi:hypothetical protein
LAITGYRVYIQRSDNSWSEETLSCNASVDATIITNTLCSIPASTLRSPPFSIAVASSIWVKVRAINGIGISLESLAGNGASMPIAPSVPGTPSGLTKDASNTY